MSTSDEQKIREAAEKKYPHEHKSEATGRWVGNARYKRDQECFVEGVAWRDANPKWKTAVDVDWQKWNDQQWDEMEAENKRLKLELENYRSRESVASRVVDNLHAQLSAAREQVRVARTGICRAIDYIYSACVEGGDANNIESHLREALARLEETPK